MFNMLDTTMPTTLAFIGGISPIQLTILLLIGLLLFGRRLPEVGRGLGKSIVEFRKGIQGIEDEIDDASKNPSTNQPKEADQLPSAQSRSDVVQPDPRSVSQEPARPVSAPSPETEPHRND
jgi:sec-independent protein translocase protein TatA